MAAWRADDVVPVLVYDSNALRQQMLREQVERVRRGRCVMCGHPVIDCDCGDYDERP